MFKIIVHRTFTDGNLKGITLRDFYTHSSNVSIAVGDEYSVAKGIGGSGYSDKVTSLIPLGRARNALVVCDHVLVG